MILFQITFIQISNKIYLQQNQDIYFLVYGTFDIKLLKTFGK